MLFGKNNQVQEVANTQGSVKYSGMSGNEMYCASLLGYKPGDLLVGNSVFAMGFIGSLRSGARTFVGGEIVTITNMIAEGRRLSLERFDKELITATGVGASGVTSELIFHPGNIEFLTVGSAMCHDQGQPGSFTTSADVQELFCQWDAGYMPVSFVFGNVAYSIGFGRNLFGSIRQMARGEVKQFSNVFNTTRNLALNRIIDEAKAKNSNSVVGIRTSILPIAGANGVQEMMMLGTASVNNSVSSLANSVGGVITSDLTAEETWNVAKIGYAPMKLLIGTSVYSLGVVGGVKAALKNYVKGEIGTLTNLIYGAREQSLNRVHEQAEQIGADDVLGIKTYIYDLGGGLIEFLAIGTAVKKVDGIVTRSEQLPPQAIIRDKDTFVDTANAPYGTTLQKSNLPAGRFS
ncbi:MAG TPA: heavy metal-binding domain-containing protein [Candidatus Saccharimonadales bacterium]